MSHHLFGSIITGSGVAANNRGENDGNITQLQKISFDNEEYSSVSAEAIRWKLRYLWQQMEEPTNRKWIDDENTFVVADKTYSEPVKFIDDDVLGFMDAKGAVPDEIDTSDEVEVEGTAKKSKKKSKKKGTTKSRRGVLEISRAISLNPYMGDITFNSKSGKEKGNTSLYGCEVHKTSYQYSFALTPDRLLDKSRIIPVLESLISLGQVGGNHARFLFDFSPKSMVLRWTQDFAPRIMYPFKEDEGKITIASLHRSIINGDIDPTGLWIAGDICYGDSEEMQDIEDAGANLFHGIKAATDDLRECIIKDLGV